jgi:hypothetical protein
MPSEILGREGIMHPSRTIDRAERRNCVASLAVRLVLFFALLFAAATQREIHSWTTTEPGQKPASAPFVIRAGDIHRTPIGLVYTPELLRALINDRQPGSLDPRIVEAVRQQTPLVVMWAAPAPMPPEIPTPPPPSIGITDRGNPASPVRFEPLWVQHDANNLALLDERVRASEVGALAAFVRAAFAPGREVCLYSDYPPDYEKKIFRSLRRCGVME